MRRFAHAFVVVTLIAVVSSLSLMAVRSQNSQEPSVRDLYNKHEYRIEMRDGVHLFTSVYIPKDTSKTYPMLMTRTPYSVAPYGPDAYPRRIGPSPEFQKAGYIFVNQDVRGRYMSEGKFVEMTPHIDHKTSNQQTDDSSDTHDTIDWLLKNVPNNNGSVGIVGISYPGFYTSASIIDSHPAIKAASPEAPMTDLFMGDDAYHGGSFMLAANFGFYVFFKPQEHPAPPQRPQPFDWGTPDGYQFYLNLGSLSNGETRYFKGSNFLWDDQVNHDTYDEYWKIRNLAPHLKNIHCAVLTVGGWFDAEDLAGPTKVYNAIKEYDPGIYNGLVFGPWVHGGWSHFDGSRLGNVNFGSKTGEFFRTQILLPFFEHYLKNAPDPQLPEAYVFETGANKWHKYPSWPPKETQSRTLYLRENGALSFDPPPATSGNSRAYDEYESDPNRPVPFVSYYTTDVPQEYMDSDQRFASTRPDVLVYQTPPLDHDVTLAGPVSPRLVVSTTGTDSDFDVKLIDVYPDNYTEPSQDQDSGNDVPAPHVTMAGFQQLVRGEPMRGKFRRSFEKAEPFVPGKMESVNFTMPDIYHTFLRGHRIMVQIQSSWFPLVDRNPQKFLNIPEAKPDDFQKATERIYHGHGQNSGLAVEVLQ